MTTAVDALLEVFTWIGFGGAALLAIAAAVVWALDGTWLPADAYLEREGDHTVVRWFDADGDANSAVASAAEAQLLAGSDRATIWYRLGWRGRMRLTRRAPGLRMMILSTGGLAALGLLCVVAGWVLYFSRA